MIQFRNVSKIFKPDTYALSDVTFHIKPGEFVSVVGQSGTGKTTLVRIMVAENRPSKGRIVIGGWDITYIKQREIPYLRRQIGVIYQDFKLLPSKTVGENVAFALEVVGAASDRISTVVPQVLKIVGLEDKIHRFPYKLSGGEQQRVAIARALVNQPKILVADEPTGNLDSINTREIIDILKKVNELGTTVLLVTHNRDVVNALRRRVITLENGQIVSDKKRGRYVL
jgi:cell division transport system ATP-binding protein